MLTNSLNIFLYNKETMKHKTTFVFNWSKENWELYMFKF
jgi:hypothetical protein